MSGKSVAFDLGDRSRLVHRLREVDGCASTSMSVSDGKDAVLVSLLILLGEVSAKERTWNTARIILATHINSNIKPQSTHLKYSTYLDREMDVVVRCRSCSSSCRKSRKDG